MKTMILLAAAMFTTAAMATPNVGDQANYQMTISKDGKTMNGMLSLELTAFNASTNQYTQKQTVKFDGADAQISEELHPSTDFATDAQLDNLLANCAAAKGTPETIQVPAGSFNTCKLINEDADGISTAWIGKVSLGLVRLEQFSKADKVNSVFVLANFR